MNSFFYRAYKCSVHVETVRNVILLLHITQNNATTANYYYLNEYLSDIVSVKNIIISAPDEVALKYIYKYINIIIIIFRHV